VVHLALHYPKSLPASLISEATQVPTGYLQKVLRILAKADLLQAQRGTGGGFSLAKMPTSIRVLDILKATDYEMDRIENCPLGLKGHTKLCALHNMLDEQIARVETVFATTSIADLVQQSNEIRPLCDVKQSGPINVSVENQEKQKKPSKNHQ
jgi:Rrf2 family protein